MRKLLLIALTLLTASTARAERVKQLADVKGARNNQLVGYGIVAGLAGTGDDYSAGLAGPSIQIMLQRLGVHIEASQLRLRNVAAVMVTADLPPNAGAGTAIDVTISSIGSAKSLEGGTLIATPLKGADLKVYALAQGPISVGGFLVTGYSGSRVGKNHTTVARIPNGARVEREIEQRPEADIIELALRVPDFTTAVRIAEKTNALVTERGGVTGAAEDAQVQAAAEGAKEEPKDVRNSWARDAGTVMVRIPDKDRRHLPDLMAAIESLDVEADVVAKVIINERTGTVVLGDTVKLHSVAIAHGGLTLQVTETPMVSQPGAFSMGNTVTVPRTQITATDVKGTLHEMKASTTLGDVVQALNSLGVTPRDLVAIVQALKASGALRAEVVLL